MEEKRTQSICKKKEQNSFFHYIFLLPVRVNYWADICVNYVRVNFVCVKGCNT